MGDDNKCHVRETPRVEVEVQLGRDLSHNADRHLMRAGGILSPSLGQTLETDKYRRELPNCMQMSILYSNIQEWRTQIPHPNR